MDLRLAASIECHAAGLLIYFVWIRYYRNVLIGALVKRSGNDILVHLSNIRFPIPPWWLNFMPHHPERREQSHAKEDSHEPATDRQCNQRRTDHATSKAKGTFRHSNHRHGS